MADVGFDLGSSGLEAHGLEFLPQLCGAQNVLGSVLAWGLSREKAQARRICPPAHK